VNIYLNVGAKKGHERKKVIRRQLGRDPPGPTQKHTKKKQTTLRERGGAKKGK